ncbi:related to monooxygenase [Fusarium mangiferae]|uniref:Related to monooxygenase n=1 Tax=Fusarium mangiferae TaxID=192010 RepID=A0A1L7TTZ6_FUSMA|nr:uncharacterized protein FMAN_08485 [Fusarium mangiferae]CVK98711.1 related to monooxygenase [Fusarium mangiferae]
MSDTQKPFAIIVGAGPCGLLLALRLAKAGLEVRVLESGHKLDDQPRATHYSPEAVEELDKAGVLPDVQAQGFVPDGLCWRKPDGTPITMLLASLVAAKVKYEMQCLPLDKLGKILYDHVMKEPNASILWGHKVTDVQQRDGGVTVTVEAESTSKLIEATYVVGCDGANSQIRRTLFGDMEFPGWTWNQQIISTTKYGFIDSNMIIDPEHWYMAARMSKDGLWKVTYGEIPGLTKEQYLERQAWKFERMLPGNPKPKDWNCTAFSPYKCHQRLAKSLRVGNILLAGDSAHLCNPFGGLGLTGGILDVGGLYDCLYGIATGQADESILDHYSDVRRQIYRDFTDPLSTENMKRLLSDPEEALEKDQFLQLCKEAATNPEVADKLAKGANCLGHDFTQYYKS